MLPMNGSVLWPWRVSGQVGAAHSRRGGARDSSALSHPCSLLLFQTLTGEELKLHVSSSNVILFSFNLTTGTIIPSQSGYDLHVSDLPVGNSTERSVGLTSKAVKNPMSFQRISFETGNSGQALWSGHISSVLCCRMPRGSMTR